MFQRLIELSDLGHSDTGLCECAACTGGVYDPDQPDYASLDPRAGGTANNKPIWTPEQIAAHLNRTGGGFADGFNDGANVGRQNNIGDDGSVVTFGFFNTVDEVIRNGYTYTANNAQGVPTLYGLSEVFNFAPFLETQRAAAREALGYWDDLVAITFRETNADDADMNFGNLANAPNTQAYARIPTASLDASLGGQIREIGGDSWYSLSQASNLQLDEGLYGMNTLTHEIGHAIGLSHPGSYNFGPGFAVTYANGAEYAQDARNYSIMSYWNPRDLGSTPTGVVTRDFDWSLMSIAYGATPMVHDILAVQRMYGVDTTTRTGDTTYGFNASEGVRDAFDFEKTPWPTMTIWDAGGNDTLDASGYNVNQTIDLTPGSLSSIGGVTYAEALEKLSFEQVNANRAAAGYAPIARATYDANMAALAAQPDFRGRLTDNVGIAYGAIIENAEGGSAKDIMIGNDAANRLSGNAGDDNLAGRSGNDTLLGGAGADVLDGGDGFDTASFINSDAGVNVSIRYGKSSEGDTLFSIENVEGSNFNDVLDGGDDANTLFGLGGNDNIDGFGGADVIDGGAGDDLIEGGDGNDVLFGRSGIDRLNGGNGDDLLEGGSGNDLLQGGAGNDVIVGGAGDDDLRGGAGKDRFVIEPGDGNDTIQDFQRGDLIDLTAFAGVDWSDISRSGNRIFVENGDNDFTIIVKGDRPIEASFVFAASGSGSAGTVDALLVQEHMIV